MTRRGADRPRRNAANGQTTPPGPQAGSWRGVKRRAILAQPRFKFLSGIPASPAYLTYNCTTTRMKKAKHLILWELLLLSSSILVFRSTWTLLDQVAWASARTGLLILLGIGFVLTILALKAVNKE
jgi:hypothetical protein